MTAPALPPSPEERYRLLLRVAESVNERLELAAVLEATRLCLEPHVPVDAIAVITVEGRRLRRHAISAARVPRVEGESARAAFGRVIEFMHGDPSFLDDELPLEGSAVEHMQRTRKTLVYSDIPKDARFPEDARLANYGIQSLVRCPLERGGAIIGTIAYAREQGRFSDPEVSLLEEVSRPVAAAVANSLAYEEISRLKTRLEEENLLRRRSTARHLGRHRRLLARRSSACSRDREGRARPTRRVLIHGETGTGKELVARAIHDRVAARRGAVRARQLRRASRPASSRASSSATRRARSRARSQRRAGRFELADGGTLFLDEVGELPLELQAKLCACCRSGSSSASAARETLRVDVRVIAATNRDLARDAAEGRFREDLYYRLNVVPDRAPAAARAARGHPAPRRALPRAATARSSARSSPRGSRRRRWTRSSRYDWPGNVRELENVIERAVILSEGDRLVLDVSALEARAPSPADRRPTTLRDQERQAIEDALRKTHGRVAGRHGAAALLDLPSTTLESKIQKLGIDKHRFRSSRDESRPRLIVVTAGRNFTTCRKQLML